MKHSINSNTIGMRYLSVLLNSTHIIGASIHDMAGDWQRAKSVIAGLVTR